MTWVQRPNQHIDTIVLDMRLVACIYSALHLSKL